MVIRCPIIPCRVLKQLPTLRSQALVDRVKAAENPWLLQRPIPEKLAFLQQSCGMASSHIKISFHFGVNRALPEPIYRNLVVSLFLKVIYWEQFVGAL